MTGRSRESVSAVVPSVIVSIVHFGLTLLLATQANIAYQKAFDNDIGLSAAESALISAYNFLSFPIIFSLHFAGHPSHAFPSYWWLMMGFNSCVWGLAAYFLSRLSLRFFFGKGLTPNSTI